MVTHFHRQNLSTPAITHIHVKNFVKNIQVKCFKMIEEWVWDRHRALYVLWAVVRANRRTRAKWIYVIYEASCIVHIHNHSAPYEMDSLRSRPAESQNRPFSHNSSSEVPRFRPNLAIIYFKQICPLCFWQNLPILPSSEWWFAYRRGRGGGIKKKTNPGMRRRDFDGGEFAMRQLFRKEECELPPGCFFEEQTIYITRN